MKSRLTSVLLCVIAFVLSLVMMLKLIEDSGHTPPDVGDGTKADTQTDDAPSPAPEDVSAAMKALLRDYNAKKKKTFDDLLDFHYRFERIHPFQDGNGRVGRLLLFKECLHCGIVPFIITDDLKAFYYRGLQNWETERGYLRDTCGLAQDRFQQVLEYFKI